MIAPTRDVSLRKDRGVLILNAMCHVVGLVIKSMASCNDVVRRWFK